MKKNNSYRYPVLALFALSSIVLSAQSDTVFNRSVTVERDFQPVIQDAGKVNIKPSVKETSIKPSEVEYSLNTYPLPVNNGLTPNLLSQPTRFGSPESFNGYIRGALGHANTLFDFGYRINDRHHSILDVYARHRAQWGMRALSRTKIGLDFTHNFSSCDLYFGVSGGNIFYQKYGRFYDYSLIDPSQWTKDKILYPNYQKPVPPEHKTTLWTADVFIGVKSNSRQDFQYKVQTGYRLFAKPDAVAEHQLRTSASFDWHNDAHHAGANLYLQNNFLTLSGNLAATVPDSLYNSRHNIRLEPYYEYRGERFMLHLGVHLDMNIGRGRNALSGVNNLSFAPSPHIRLEAEIAKKWLTLYVNATGTHAPGTLQAYMESNRYRLIHPGIISHHSAPHTPVDGELGFHIRPHRDVFVELHGGYALYLNTTALIATADSAFYRTVGVPLQAGDFSYTYCDYGRGKVGAELHYHYRDYVRVNVRGDYFFWQAFRYESNGYNYPSPPLALSEVVGTCTSRTVYDRAAWQLGIRVDGKIDRHWSLYSDNRFEGSRMALATDGEHVLKPTVQLDLGVQYNMWVGRQKQVAKHSESASVLSPEPRPNLTLFLQLNNWLHRKNDIYYGYSSEGINFLLGATYRF